MGSTIQARLLQGGHYRLSGDGRLRSVYFEKVAPVRIRSYRDNEAVVANSTPLMAGNLDDVQAGKHDVLFFEDYAERRDYHSGLAECVRIEEEDRPPIYVIDNHEKAYFAWREAQAMGYINRGAVLVHIDAHADNSEPRLWPEPSWGLREIAQYLSDNVGIAEFVLPAVWDGTVDEYWWLPNKPKQTLSSDPLTARLMSGRPTSPLFTLEQRARGEALTPWLFQAEKRDAALAEILARVGDPKSLILDIDLDAWFEPHYLGEDQPPWEAISADVRLLAEIAKRAGVVTIATSPGFADQKMALDLVRRIVNEIIA